MGYNPYICIVCGVVEDNGWGRNIPYYQRIKIILERLGRKSCPFYDEKEYIEDDFCSYVTTCDVCDKCFKKGTSIKNKFFEVRHSKEERREYWKKHCKKHK